MQSQVLPKTPQGKHASGIPPHGARPYACCGYIAEYLIWARRTGGSKARDLELGAWAM
jgi:hypothetical protein